MPGMGILSYGYISGVAAAGAGDVKLMFSDQGTYPADNTEAERSTHTFAAGDFAANDMVYVVVMDNATGSFASSKIQIYDGTNTVNVTGPAGAYVRNLREWFIYQGGSANTNLQAFHKALSDADVVETTAQEATMVASWITTAWTIRLRGLANTQIGYWKLWVYKVSG